MRVDKAIEQELRRAQGRDGGFGPRPGAASEPEPTALAAIALLDPAATDWLAAHQTADGSVGMRLGPVWTGSNGPSTTWPPRRGARPRIVRSCHTTVPSEDGRGRPERRGG
jgi:hypothetical protein